MHVTLENLWTIEGLVAAGTLALALATAALALSTRNLARSTKKEVQALSEDVELSRQTVEAVRKQAASAEEQVAVARNTLGATFRPVVVSVPPDVEFPPNYEERLKYLNGPETVFRATDRHSVHVQGSPKHVHFSAPVRNVGAGVAFIAGTWLQWEAGEGHNGLCTNAILPPAEVARLYFSIPQRGEQETLKAILDYGSFSIRVRYTDLGGNAWETRLDLSKALKSRTWFVSQVFLKAAEADDSDAVGSGAMFEP